MRFVYLGTSDFAAGVLRRMASDGGRTPVLVVTPPDRRRGRGRKLAPVPVAALADELGVEVLRTEATEQPESMAAIRAAGADLGVVCAFGQILRPGLLDELELINVHPSLLPRWRGAAPIERAIMAGDDATGVSIMRVIQALDAGPVALAERVSIARTDDYGTLAVRLEAVAASLLRRALELFERGELRFAEQDESQVTYAHRIEPAERRLTPAAPAAELERRVRALSPHVGAYVELSDGARLGVLAAAARPGELAPGEFREADGLVLGCSRGVLELVSVRPPGGRPMAGADYLRGHPLPETSPE